MSTADVLPYGITGPIMEIPEGKYPPHEAIDFYHRYKEDIALFLPIIRSQAVELSSEKEKTRNRFNIRLHTISS